MAIGKVNAYATVQAPNVDFGDIALNAQKFQDADIEKQKELKVAQLKAKEIKPIEYGANGEVIPSGLKVYDLAVNKLTETAIQRKNDLYNKATSLGGVGFLSPEEQSEYYRVPDLIKTLTETNKQVGANAKLLVENVGKKSGVMQSKLDLLGHGFDNQEDAEPIYSNGSYMFKFPEIEVTNNPTTGEAERRFVLDGNGKKVYKKFYNRDGTQTDAISQSEMQNGKAYDVMDSYDPNEDAKKIQATIVGNEVGTDNGYKKVSNLYYGDDRVKTAIDSSINSLVSDRDKRVNVLYNYYQAHKNDKNLSEQDKANLERYSHPMLEKEYTDKDKNIARGEYENIIFGKFGRKHTEDVSQTAIDRGQEQEKYNYTIGRATWAQNKLGGSISRDVDKTAFGFPLVKVPMYSVKAGHYFNEQGVAATNPLPAGSYISNMTLIKKGDKEIPGFVVQQLDAKSSREVQDKMSGLDFGNMNLDQQQEATNSILSSYGNKYTQHIYTFSKEDADNILRQQTIGANKGKGYNVDFAKTTLRNAQPKEKVNKQQSNQAKSVSVGDVVGGYKYLGGDTSNKNSWLLIRDK